MQIILLEYRILFTFLHVNNHEQCAFFLHLAFSLGWLGNSPFTWLCDQDDPGPWMAAFTGEKRRPQTDTPVQTTEQPP